MSLQYRRYPTLRGVPVGSITASGVLMLAAPSRSIGAASIGLGVLICRFWGSFFGGLGGTAPNVLNQPGSAYPIAEDSSDIVVAHVGAHVSAQVNAARKAIQAAGARYLFADVPAVRPSGLVLSAAR